MSYVLLDSIPPPQKTEPQTITLWKRDQQIPISHPTIHNLNAATSQVLLDSTLSTQNTNPQTTTLF